MRRTNICLCLLMMMMPLAGCTGPEPELEWAGSVSVDSVNPNAGVSTEDVCERDYQHTSSGNECQEVRVTITNSGNMDISTANSYWTASGSGYNNDGDLYQESAIAVGVSGVESVSGGTSVPISIYFSTSSDLCLEQLDYSNEYGGIVNEMSTTIPPFEDHCGSS